LKNSSLSKSCHLEGFGDGKELFVRILILSINYWPEETGIGAFTTYRAEYLASAGHDVTVCTTFPYYPEWKVAPEYKGRLLSSEERNGVRILRIYSYVPNPVTSLKRVVHEASFVAASLLRSAALKRPDVVLVTSPPLGLAMSAFLLKRLWRIPYVFDVMDLQPDAAADLGMLPAWILRLMYRVESAAYRHAALVSTLTKGLRGRIVEKGVAAEKVVLFEPRADESLLDIGYDEGAAFRQRYGLDGKFIVSHSGNLGIKQGLDVILDAAAMSREDASLLFLLVGDGSAREEIERRAAELKLENLRFLPVLAWHDFRGLLAASDVCLVTQRKSVSDIVFPSKAVTYLSAGCAVIASVNAGSEVATTILESGAGAVVEPENALALQQAIYELRAVNLQERRRSARDYARLRWSSDRVLGYLERNLAAVSASTSASIPEQEPVEQVYRLP
jgi:colanic acid biosynthesis glycosyl transferase WcaI